MKNYSEYDEYVDWYWKIKSTAVFGGHWSDAFYSGSDISNWSIAPSAKHSSISIRNICNHKER